MGLNICITMRTIPCHYQLALVRALARLKIAHSSAKLKGDEDIKQSVAISPKPSTARQKKSNARLFSSSQPLSPLKKMRRKKKKKILNSACLLR